MLPSSTLRSSLPVIRRPAGRAQAGHLCLIVWCLLAGLCGCRRPPAPPGNTTQTVANAVSQTSHSCRECHEAIYAAWRATDHALANRPAGTVDRSVVIARFIAQAGSGSGLRPEFILGNKPLWQPLLATPGGRWQAHELAFDPARQEWFNVFGAEGRRPGEWGHWTGRGMNWNSMCAHCHMTGFRKGYSAARDSYDSSWVEHGVGCIQCHGPTKAGHGYGAPPAQNVNVPAPADRQGQMQTCAPCHARSEQLTVDFQPGDNFHDHYRVVLPVDPAVYYPDGQQRDEDFNWTSVLLSRMGHAGVTCFDCHDAHTTRTLWPATDNLLCLQCHAAPGRTQPNGTRAVPIDPVAHSRHAEGSTGNACVACHMPTTNYMQRAPRHDHGWLRPDPLITKELGIPNACNRCHQDQNVDWAIAKTEEWYGSKMQSRQRARARAVSSAQAGEEAAPAALLALLQSEEIPAWRATYLSLLGRYVHSQSVVAAGELALGDRDPLVRSAAARLLTGSPGSLSSLRPLLDDPIRLVRLDAAWALSAELPAGSRSRRELDDYLSLSLDQPTGRLRHGQDLANRGLLAEAEREMTQAAAWDPFSPGIAEAQATLLTAMGRPAAAAEKYVQAAGLAPLDASYELYAALAFAESGNLEGAEKHLRQAVARNPQLDRAWYNLGLLLAQKNQPIEAAEALRRAESCNPKVADYPYALATVLLQIGDRAGAHLAVQRTLALDPQHQAARSILPISAPGYSPE